MDPQSSTGRTEDDFEENRPIGDHAQLSAYQRVSIEDVLNPRPANPIPISSSSAANEFSIGNYVNSDIKICSYNWFLFKRSIVVDVFVV